MASGLNSLWANIVCGSVFLGFYFVPYFFLIRLVKIEKENFPDQWEKDFGSQKSLFWIPSQELSLLSLLWLVRTPEWVKDLEIASKSLKYYRFVSYIVYLILFGGCLLILLSASVPK